MTSLRPLAQLSAAGAIEQVYLYGTSPLTPDVILSNLTESGGTWTGNTYRVIADQVGVRQAHHQRGNGRDGIRSGLLTVWSGCG